MGMTDYVVNLTPKESTPLKRARDPLAALAEVEAHLKQKWPAIHSDAEALRPLETVLFQILLGLRGEPEEVHIYLRFAYCNSRSVYEPFLAVIEWLMRTYQLECNLMRPMPADEGGKPIKTVLDDPEELASQLLPDMDFYRTLWRGTAGAQEAKLRLEAVEAGVFQSNPPKL